MTISGKILTSLHGDQVGLDYRGDLLLDDALIASSNQARAVLIHSDLHAAMGVANNFPSLGAFKTKTALREKYISLGPAHSGGAVAVDLLAHTNDPNYSAGVLTGPGIINGIQFISGNGASQLWGQFKIYVDDEVDSGVPGLVFDFSSLGFNLMANNVTLYTPHIAAIAGNSSADACMYFGYPIPYNRIKIEFIQTIGFMDTQDIWTVVTYTSGPVIPYRLKNKKAMQGALLSLTAATANAGYISLGSDSGEGYIAHVGYGAYSGGATAWDFLEHNIDFYFDGRDAAVGQYPDFGSTGTEDFFKFAYYGEIVAGVGTQIGSRGTAFLAQAAASTGGYAYAWSAGRDLLAEFGQGLHFDNGFKAYIGKGPSVSPEVPGGATTTQTIAYQILYYKKVA